MANQVFLIAALSALVAVSSASFFYLRQPESAPNTNERQKPGVVASRPSWTGLYNNHINDGNSNVATTEETPLMPGLSRCDQQSSRDLRPHPEDCARFQMCSAGVLISFTCPSGSVFHNSSKSCVAKGSAYDTCTSTEQTDSHLICPPRATYKKAHPKECAQYYHCGEPAQEARWEKHLKECEYPLLYNIATKRCEHFSMVTCGLRREPYDPCEYKSNECGSTHCVPCSVRHPSCRGKKNGMNGWEGREGSPHYVVCASQRVVYHGMCPQDHGTHIFDHATGTCTMMNAKQSAVRHY